MSLLLFDIVILSYMRDIPLSDFFSKEGRLGLGFSRLLVNVFEGNSGITYKED
jgi:hypothetical protein